jgi:hypothetical protein
VQLHPAAIAVFAIDDVVAMHRVKGMACCNKEQWKASREMFNLIAWARGIEASAQFRR